MLALLFAVLAILSQPVRPPSTFIEGLQWSAPVIEPYFIGAAWVCDPLDAGDYGDESGRITNPLDLAELRAVALDPTNDYAEVCYAGLEYGFDDAAGFVTGP